MVRSGLHVVAAVVIIVGFIVRITFDGALWAVLLSEMLVGVALFWFFLPWYLRLNAFIKRLRP